MSEFSQDEKNILQNLKAGHWSEAEQIAFAIDDNAKLTLIRDDILKTTRFWQKRNDYFTYTDTKSGAKLFAEWEDFVEFCLEYKIYSQKVFFAAKSYVFNKIIDFLSRASRDSENSNKEVLVLLAYAFYESGMINRAVETLEFILGRFPDEDDFRVYTLLGDIYSESVNDPQKLELAEIIFSELFLNCINTLDLDSIESPFILKIIDLVKGDMFPDSKVKYWVPIYGYLYGGLTIRRNLRYDEYKKLQDKISYLENELRVVESTEVIIPQLLNVYFWVFDYYIYQMKTSGGAQQIYRRVLELFAMLYQIHSYEESAKALGLQSEKVLDNLLQTI